jgi:hypothetical protein
MRIQESITYQEDPLDSVGIISTWDVPYSVEVNDRGTDDAETNGMPVLKALHIKVGTVIREMQMPVDDEERKAWMAYWCKHEPFIYKQLIELFCADAVTRYWERRSEAA